MVIVKAPTTYFVKSERDIIDTLKKLPNYAPTYRRLWLTPNNDENKQPRAAHEMMMMRTWRDEVIVHVRIQHIGCAMGSNGSKRFT